MLILSANQKKSMSSNLIGVLISCQIRTTATRYNCLYDICPSWCGHQCCGSSSASSKIANSWNVTATGSMEVMQQPICCSYQSVSKQSDIKSNMSSLLIYKFFILSKEIKK